MVAMCAPRRQIPSALFSEANNTLEDNWTKRAFLLSNGAKGLQRKDAKGSLLDRVLMEPEILEIIISHGGDVRAQEENSTSLVSRLFQLYLGDAKTKLYYRPFTRESEKSFTPFFLTVHEQMLAWILMIT